MEGRFTWEVEWMDLVTGWVRKVMEMTLRFCSCMKEYILILWDPMNRSMPGLPVHHLLPEFTQTHVYRVGDAIQPSHPLSSPSPSAT